MRDRMRFCVPCLFGVEGLVAQELREMELEEVQAENGRVLFSGGWEAMVRANLNSRFGERVLLLLGEFPARSFEELFQGVKALPWEELLGREDQFPVTGSSLSSQLHSVPDCQAIVKKAIVERLKAQYRLSWFPETGSLHRVRFRILKDQVSVMVDTSGEGLHKRGYRAQSNEAPIKETLAASLCQLSRLRSDGHLIDPFCGSGTLLVEGALLALRIAPGLQRTFTAQTWTNVPKALWQQERDRARSLERRDGGFSAQGFDIDPAAVELTLENARKAGVEEYISASVRDIRAFSQEGRYGCVICNPPYGERLLDVRQAQQLYQSMGSLFRPQRGWSFGIITPDPEFEALFGRKADKRRKLYNGMIQCQYYQYFRGRKKAVTLLQRLRGEMETPRLLLRHWREEDYQDFLAFASDPQVMLASGARPARTREEGERFFHRALWDSGCYAIVLKETGHPIGKIKFQRDIRRSGVKSLSIGYELAKPYWGQGYMTEALRAMVQYGFERKGLDVLAIGHFKENSRSRRVIEKCGFHYEGTLSQAFQRFDGKVFDDVCYSILREDYFSCPERYKNP